MKRYKQTALKLQCSCVDAEQHYSSMFIAATNSEWQIKDSRKYKFETVSNRPTLSDSNVFFVRYLSAPACFAAMMVGNGKWRHDLMGARDAPWLFHEWRHVTCSDVTPGQIVPCRRRRSRELQGTRQTWRNQTHSPLAAKKINKNNQKTYRPTSAAKE